MKKILIVEDDDNIAHMLQAKLTASGYKTILASDGITALKAFQKSKPALILLDLVLPKKSGFEVMEDIRIKHGSTIPILVLSNLDQPADRETASRFGVSEYIVKSNISLQYLVGRIHELLK